VKCNTGKVCNCLIQFLLTILLSVEKRVFLVEYVFRKGNRYTDLVQEQFAENFTETPVSHRNAVRRLIEQFREVTACIRNISQADLQKAFANKIKRVQACIDALGHHFQHLLYMHQRLSERTVDFASCNLKRVASVSTGPATWGTVEMNVLYRSPCVCSSGQTYSNFEVRSIIRLSRPEFPNLCVRTLCSLAMRFQMFMHRLFQITSSDVNYT
jgi:hypothetical protein